MLLAASTLHAQDAVEPSLAGCVQEVSDAASTQGAKPYGEPVVQFLLSGDQRSHSYALPSDGCFGFLAVGQRQVHRVGLTLYAPTGRVLVRDAGTDAYGYARFCGKAGRELEVEVRMLDGEGELYLLPLWDAPASIDALAPAMQRCMHTGAPRPIPIDVGPEPAGPAIELEMMAVAKRLMPLGYQLENGMLVGGLPEQRQEARRILLEGDRCYALAAVGDPDVEDIDLRLLAITDQARLVASDTTRRRDAVVKVCPEQSGVFVLDVRMYRGSGNYAIRSFNLHEPKESATSKGLEAATRIPFAEMNARVSERGMDVEAQRWGVLVPGTDHAMPIRVRAGQCYGVGAIATADIIGSDLDLSVTDAQGRLQAADIGASTHPLVFHCAERDGTLRAVVHPNDLRRPARFMVVVASTPSDGGALLP